MIFTCENNRECLNGGTCVQVTRSTEICKCALGFTGRRCQAKRHDLVSFICFIFSFQTRNWLGFVNVNDDTDESSPNVMLIVTLTVVIGLLALLGWKLMKKQKEQQTYIAASYRQRINST